MVDRVYERNASDSAPQPPANPSSGYPTAGNPTQGVPATLPGPYWYHMITESLRRVVVKAGLTPDHEDLDQLLGAIKSSGQFADYSEGRTYETGEVARGSDGHFYEFYDRDGDGTVQGVDPTNSDTRPHIWMRWDGNRPGQTIPWRTETPPEGYIVNDGDDYSRTDYRRIFDAWGTTYGEGDGETTFGSPDDRGEFLRGWDNGRGVDSERGFAEHQMDQMQQITGGTSSADLGILSRVTDATVSGTGAFRQGDLRNRIYSSQTSTASGRELLFDSSGSPDARTGDSTYPRNNAVNWITKI